MASNIILRNNNSDCAIKKKKHEFNPINSQSINPSKKKKHFKTRNAHDVKSCQFGNNYEKVFFQPVPAPVKTPDTHKTY